jgi:uncharacterized protein
METVLLSCLVFLAAVLLMAVGVLFGRREIKGSCGGLNRVAGKEDACPLCSGECKNNKRGRAQAA